jgi:hypothetical protein
MKNEFAPYELALRMKTLGFDEPCFGFYKLGNINIYYGTILQGQNHKFRNNTQLNFYGDLKEKISAPTYSQAFRWFREKYDLYPSINIYNDKWLCLIKSTVQSEIEVSGYIVATINNGHPTFETYEEAELACLEKLIEIVESK